MDFNERFLQRRKRAERYRERWGPDARTVQASLDTSTPQGLAAWRSLEWMRLGIPLNQRFALDMALYSEQTRSDVAGPSHERASTATAITQECSEDTGAAGPIPGQGTEDGTSPETLEMQLESSEGTTDHKIDVGAVTNSESSGTYCNACEAPLISNPRLCRHCQRWTMAEHAFYCAGNMFYGTDLDCRYLENWLSNTDCIICQALVPAVLQRLKARPSAGVTSKMRVMNCGPYYCKGGMARGRRWTENQEEHIADQEDVQSSWLRQDNLSIPCVFVLILAENPADHRPRTNEHADIPLVGEQYVCVRARLSYVDAGSVLTNISLLDTPHFNITALRRLLSACESTHLGSCRPQPSELPAGFKLIDIELQCISPVASGDDLQFAALSYVWQSTSAEEFEELTTAWLESSYCSGSLTTRKIPALIRDAITVCQDMRVRYLWTDRLCIVQDDPQDLGHQIAKMDQIYSAAYFTIASVVEGKGNKGLPGARNRPRSPAVLLQTRVFTNETTEVKTDMVFNVDDSSWNTRGWTFQERILSRRTIFIADQQVYFICEGTVWQEELGKLQQELYYEPSYRTRNLTTSIVPRIPQQADFNAYKDFVELYTARQLSYESDIVNAFQGLSNSIAGQWQTRFHFGLPEKYFDRSLLFCTTSSRGLRDNLRDIPTWSWAAWDGKILHNNLAFSSKWHTPLRIHFYGSLVHFHIMLKGGVLHTLDMDRTWMDGAIDVSRLLDRGFKDSDVRIKSPQPHPEAAEEQKLYGRMGPTEHWEACPHNPLEVTKHTKLETAAVATAMNHPGATVFNTTVAHFKLGPMETEEHLDLAMFHLDEATYARILDDRGEPIGRLAFMPRKLLASWHNEVERFKLIVISACINPDKPFTRIRNKAESALQERLEQWKGWQEREHPRSILENARYMWWLLVMLVGHHKDDPVVCYRRAVGYIYMKDWRLCNPRWETVVLV